MIIMSRKQAKECNSNVYFTGKPCKHGHISQRQTSNGQCVVCRKETLKRWQDENREKARISSDNWKQNNKQKVKEYTRKYRLDNHEKVREATKEWFKEHPKYREYYRKFNKHVEKEYIEKNKSRIREYQKQFRAKNPELFFVRHCLNRVVNNWKGGRSEMESLLGYTFKDLKEHIEAMFVEGMSWENRSEWHIDHIKPIHLFIKENIVDPSVINALSNLQPLWAKDNLSKSGKYNELNKGLQSV